MKKILKQRKCMFLLTIIMTLMFSSISYAIVPYGFDYEDIYKQPETITEKYFTEPTLEIKTPAFEEGKEFFTTHDEMWDFINTLNDSSDVLEVLSIGQTTEGLETPLLLFSKEGVSSAEEAVALGKPIVWYQAQIHGNEPASGEASLEIARRLANGTLDVLDDITVVIVPRINGDGSFYFQRTPNRMVDSNRDHLKFDNIETINLHKAMNEFSPHVVIDAHEYGVDGTFSNYGEEGGLTYYDLLISSAKNLNIPESIRQYSDDIFVTQVHEAIDEADLTSNYYYTGSYPSEGVMSVLEAGYDARIGRNATGLKPSFAFLLETRGIGIGKDDFKRRVSTQIVAATSILETTAQNSEEVYTLINDARTDIINSGKTVSEDDVIIITSKRADPVKDTLEIIDLASESVVEIEVDFSSATNAEPTLSRIKPTAYILPAAYSDLAEKISYTGTTVRKLDSDAITLPVETYKLIDNSINTTYYEGALRNTVTTEIETTDMTFYNGAYIITMDQPTAYLAALQLEPESEDSFVTFSKLPVQKNTYSSQDVYIPIYRYMEDELPSSSIVYFD